MSHQERTPEGSAGDGVGRRGFLSSASGVAMTGGLVGGYGMLAGLAAQYAFPADEPVEWLYVAPAERIAPGESMTFVSPARARVIITRRAESAGRPAEASDFLALSSTCPHLGCQVHWEPAGERFFCPCHHGSFDAEGQPTGGPVLADNQALPQFELTVRSGLLFIRMPSQILGGTA